MKEQTRGYMELILFSLFIGSVGIFVKLINGLDVRSMIFFRYGIAAILIFLIVFFFKKIKELKICSPVKTLLVGLSLGVASLFYFNSIVNTSVTNAVFLLYTAPIFSLFLSKIFLGEKVEKRTYIGIVLALAGIILILDPKTFSFESKQTLGNLMGLAAGFFYALQGLLAKSLRERVSGYYTAFWQSIVISIMFLFFLKIKSMDVIVGNWWQILGLGILGAGIPTILFMNGIKKIKGQEIFIITSLEPLAGTLFALLALHEVPTLLTISGAVFILGGIFWVTKKPQSVSEPEINVIGEKSK